MKEYALENGEKVDLKKLEVELDTSLFPKAHEGLVIPYQDIYIQYEEGILMLRLNTNSDEIKPVSERIRRGVPNQDSLREKVLKELNLELDDIAEGSPAREFSQEDPFGHGKGSDTLTFVYYSKARKLDPDILNKKSVEIITREKYINIKKDLSPRLQDDMDIAFKLKNPLNCLREYIGRTSQKIDLKRLEKELDTDIYCKANEGLVNVCHDIYVQQENGILLVNRLGFPAKNETWPLGGRIRKGITFQESLRKKVYEESNLDLYDIQQLGLPARVFLQKDSFGHGKGSDAVAFVYFGRVSGSLKLNELHNNQIIVSPSEYPKLRERLHPYVRDYMDLAILLVK
jgi:ADP-ribose pyrophosphatase YjhB (NUDIX family)